MGCVESLQQTLARIDQSEALRRDRETCQSRGLRPTAPEFATCVVGLGQASAHADTAGHAL
jgi:hypothetical protein